MADSRRGRQLSLTGTRVGRRPAQIVVVRNWSEELKRLVPVGR
jgi:hypothetical protein